MQHRRLMGFILHTMLLGFAMALCSCSSSYTVSSAGSPNSEYSYREMNEELSGRRVRIELSGGREIYAKEVTISNDSVSWVDASTFEKSKAITQDVKRIVIKNHLVGGLEGLGIVAPVVFAGTWGIGGFPREGLGGSEGWVLPAVLGLMGGGIGSITGLIIGHRYYFEFQTTQQRDTSQNGK